MQVRVFKDAATAGLAAATVIATQILEKPNAVLGLATGSSPIPIYRELAQYHRRGILDFSRVHTFNLDEYVGLPKAHPCSYHRFMREELFDHVNLAFENTFIPDGCAADMQAHTREYDALIAQHGGIDLQLLGIGRNGHIGFNEPGDAFIHGCHVVTLAQSTIEANRRFFSHGEAVPNKAVTMGIGGIMEAREIVLIATGADKAQAVYGAVRGDITPALPASALRLHPNCIFMLDEAAAGAL